MSNDKCPNCESGRLIQHVEPRYTTKLKGVPIEVSDAKFWRCDGCGESIVDAKEIRRWEEIAKKSLALQLPTASDVRSVRGEYSVADFASLIGVTRQTVYVWERCGVPLGPAALVVALLKEENEGRISGIFQSLVEMASGRGVTLSSPSPGGAPSTVSVPAVPAIRNLSMGFPTLRD